MAEGTLGGASSALFPFPGADAEVEQRSSSSKKAGASFAVAAPLLLTPRTATGSSTAAKAPGSRTSSRTRLFHADVSRGLHALERRAGVTLHKVGMDPFLP